MSRVLVTGGTSFVVAPLVNRLANAGHDVVVLSHSGDRHRLPKLSCEMVSGDVRDARDVARAANGCHSVVHAAFAPAESKPTEISECAILGTFNVLRACERQHVTKLMVISSPRADGQDHYGICKRSVELMAQAWMATSPSCLRLIIARPFNVYGPDMGSYHVIPQFILRMLGMDRQYPAGAVFRFPVRGDGRDMRSFSYVTDVADQLYELFSTAPSGTFDAGNGDDPQSVDSVALEVAWALGRSGDMEILHGTGFGRVERFADPPVWLTPARVGFKEGLLRTVQWYREHEKEFNGRGQI